ncbi:hypothetical protein SEA_PHRAPPUCCINO_89 [Mycobacterium phage Phrappuccino]|uniref:Uncharacterized protein n=1 Tax=Mycobacterium phage Phrappuccino TaxID=2591223 RepID=A0A514DDS9_9CAUD|nr:hypothetical protein KHQ87_gp089 [Mycobacterium phage Phrappuccino]QDH91764.1 hypothetical protein SEA_PHRAPPUCCINO_89 [Mycobacterium phage Phrappuccino]QIQ63206.1 hypothetical protein SEA_SETTECANDELA_89 [Mycobacterium phage Settecandela]
MSNRVVQCKRCGDVNVAWVKSKRTGRFYLAMTAGRARSSGESPQVLSHRPHQCDPARVEQFQAEIAGYAAARGVTVEEWWQGK